MPRGTLVHLWWWELGLIELEQWTFQIDPFPIS